MSRRPVIGVMGAGDGASARDCALAEALGAEIARRGWALLCGGRAAGVMDAAARGARSVEGSLVVGVLPGDGEDPAVSTYLDVAIFTGMGNARNAINVLSSDVVVACGAGGPGTASEIALALKSGKPVVLLAPPEEMAAFFRRLDPRARVAASADEAAELAARELRDRQHDR
jgi:uncharacterized protein (TIGR00725 family)